MLGCEFACAHACQVPSVRRLLVNPNELGVDSVAEGSRAVDLPVVVLGGIGMASAH